MRDEFVAITSGWTLVDDLDDLADRIERAAELRPPLDPDERATVRLMIESLGARSSWSGGE